MIIKGVYSNSASQVSFSLLMAILEPAQTHNQSHIHNRIHNQNVSHFHLLDQAEISSNPPLFVEHRSKENGDGGESLIRVKSVKSLSVTSHTFILDTKISDNFL